MKSFSSSSWLILASSVGLAILYPLRWRIGRTAPSRRGLRYLFECQLAASGPVSASPSPTTQAGVVEDGTVRVSDRVSELTSLVNRSGSLGRHLTGNASREGELPKELPQTFRVRRDVWV